MHDKDTGPLILEPGKNCEAFAMIGSQVIPGAATETSDTDIAILLGAPFDTGAMFDAIITSAEVHRSGVDGEYHDCVISDGEGYDGHEDGTTSCKIYRGDKVWNYLVFTDADYFHKFVDATSLAIWFGLVEKAHRVELFQFLCDGVKRGDGTIPHVEIHKAEEVPF